VEREGDEMIKILNYFFVDLEKIFIFAICSKCIVCRIIYTE